MTGSLREKLKTLGWFVRRPTFYPHFLALIARQLAGASHYEKESPCAYAWASRNAVAREQALAAIGLRPDAPRLPAALVPDAEQRARLSVVEMGGSGDVDLIYGSILASGATRVVETGVAYGWSSLAALAALNENGGRLVSVDMPYPKANNERFVGIVVPQEMRARWTLIRQPDRNGLKRAIAQFNGEIDLCHYDSDKSYSGRMFGYPLLWRALKSGGIFISDDIDDNFAFRDFFQSAGVRFAILESNGRYVGMARKQAN